MTAGALPREPVRRRPDHRSRGAAAVGLSLLLHAGVAAALLQASRPPGAPAPAPPLTVALVPPPPPAPPSPAPAGGGRAPAPKAPRAASPVPRPAELTPLIRPPVAALETPPPLALRAPQALRLGAPDPSPGAGAGRGGEGEGLGAGRGAGAGDTEGQPEWVDWPGPGRVADAYPKDAARQGLTGSVELRCWEGLDGRVSRCTVRAETPPDAGFGPAALRLSRWFRFTPSRQDGRPVEAWVTIPYDFSVDDAPD